jgi:predicted Zn-dependent protease
MYNGAVRYAIRRFPNPLQEVMMINGISIGMRRSSLALVVILALFLASCATTGINKGQFNLVTSDEEVQMGKDLSVEVEKEYPVYENADVTAYVQSVGGRITRICDRRDIEYHFAVVEKDELNAFALPGGYIYIYTGLMNILDDEAQLAAVLAHEVGHVAARHSTERLTTMYGYSVLANMILGDDPNFWAGLAANLFSTTGMLAYSRKNEYEADRLGATYANAAGYDPAGMSELLDKFRITEMGNPSKLEEWLSTHPPSSERISRVNSYIRELPGAPIGIRNKAAYARIKEQLPQ